MHGSPEPAESSGNVSSLSSPDEDDASPLSLSGAFEVLGPEDTSLAVAEADADPIPLLKVCDSGRPSSPQPATSNATIPRGRLNFTRFS